MSDFVRSCFSLNYCVSTICSDRALHHEEELRETEGRRQRRIHLLSAFLCCLPSLLHVLLVLAVINNVVKVTPP